MPRMPQRRYCPRTREKCTVRSSACRGLTRNTRSVRAQPGRVTLACFSPTARLTTCRRPHPGTPLSAEVGPNPAHGAAAPGYVAPACGRASGSIATSTERHRGQLCNAHLRIGER